MEERLQKLISASGLTSRRGAEDWITAGRVTVNGQVAALGDKADLAHDQVLVDGRPLPQKQTDRRTYLMLNKPRGYVSTLSDEKGRRTVAQLVSGCGCRVWPVGRLDMDSEGLLLLTDDGELTHRLTHPSHRVEKEYVVKVRGDAAQALSLLRAPMVIDGEDMETDRVELTGKNTLTMVIHQGKNRQIRRMCAAAGLDVLRLKRVREGGLRLHDLQAGCWKLLTNEDIFLLKL